MATYFPAYEQSLIESGSVFGRNVVARLYRSGDYWVDANVISGSVSMDLRRSHRSQGNIVVSTDGERLPFPLSPYDILSPFGTEVDLRTFVNYPNGEMSPNYVSLGRFVVTKASGTASTTGETEVSLTLGDLAERVSRYRFEQPFILNPPRDLANIVNQVITDRFRLPGHPRVGSTFTSTVTIGLDAETDPFEELHDLAEGRGFLLFYNRVGRIVIVREEEQGESRRITNYTEVSIDYSEQPQNIVVVRYEPADGGIPIEAVARDNDPSSPTFVEGPYGRVTRFYSSPLLQNTSEAQQAAETMLNRVIKTAAQWEITIPWNPTFDPNDVIRVEVFGRQFRLSVDEVNFNVLGETTLRAKLEVVG